MANNVYSGDNISISASNPKSLNKGSNGIWIGPKWIREDEESIISLLKYLNDFEINRLYLNLGEIKPLDISNNNRTGPYQFEVYFNGFNINNEIIPFPRDDYEMIRDFAAAIKNFNEDHYSDFKVIGVINGNEKYDLLNNDENEIDSLINITKATINFFNSERFKINKDSVFDGFQLDIEPVDGGSIEFLRLLVEIKNILPIGQFLSIAISQVGTENDPYICSDHYIEEDIAPILGPGDEIALMAYNLGLNVNDYKEHIATQAYILTNSISTKKIDFSVYIPLFPEDNKNINHSTEIENIENALTGLLHSKKMDEVIDDFSRVIIYNYDQLYGTGEWIKGFDDFKNLWLNGAN